MSVFFYLSVIGWIITYGKCRQWYIEANKAAAKQAKTLHYEYPYLLGHLGRDTAPALDGCKRPAN